MRSLWAAANPDRPAREFLDTASRPVAAAIPGRANRLLRSAPSARLEILAGMIRVPDSGFTVAAAIRMPFSIPAGSSSPTVSPSRPPSGKLRRPPALHRSPADKRVVRLPGTANPPARRRSRRRRQDAVSLASVASPAESSAEARTHGLPRPPSAGCSGQLPIRSARTGLHQDRLPFLAVEPKEIDVISRDLTFHHHGGSGITSRSRTHYCLPSRRSAVAGRSPAGMDWKSRRPSGSGSDTSQRQCRRRRSA